MKSARNWGRLGMKCEYRQLGDVAIQFIDGDRGKNYPSNNEFSNVGYCLFLNAKNVTPDGFSFGEVSFITQKKDAMLRKGKLEKNDVVLTTRGTVGNVAFYGERVLYSNVRINSGMLIIRPDPSVFCPEYVYWLFRSDVIQDQIKRFRSGTAQPQLPISSIKKFEIPLVDIKTQKEIAAILSALDEKIATNRAINDNLEQQAMSLYAEIFLNSSDSNVTSGTLSDIAVITMGQSPSGSSYNEDGVGEVFYQGRAEFGFRFPKRRLFTTEPKRMAEAGDVLLSVRAPVGDLNIAYERCCIGRGLGAIHSKTGHSSFVLYTMFALRSQLDVFNGEGTVFGSINRDALNAIPIDIPPVTEIDQFEVVAHPIDELIRANYEENCRLEAIRDSLLPKLMSGEIDVSNVQL